MDNPKDDSWTRQASLLSTVECGAEKVGKTTTPPFDVVGSALHLIRKATLSPTRPAGVTPISGNRPISFVTAMSQHC